MADIMEGVRILEVAEHTFVPAASAILADWGAEVIKIEHPERGDAMRGLASSGVMPNFGAVHVLLEHSNRGKRSIGIDIQTEAGIELIYKLAETSDVFLTNKLPAVRERLRIRARGHPCPQSQHHLCRRHGLWGARTRCESRGLRLLELLVPWYERHGVDDNRCRLPHRPTRAGIWRLHRRHDDCGRDTRRALPSGTDGRGQDARRLAPRRRHVGHEPGDRPFPAAGPCMATGSGWRDGTVQSARRYLSDPGRAVPGVLVPPGLPLLARRLQGRRPRGPHRRPPVRHAGAVGRERRRRTRDPGRDLLGVHIE